MLMILTEKPSAAKNFAKALGGKTGTYDGKQYKIVNSVGHLLTFKEPHEMVHPDDAADYQGWEPGLMPWDISKMSWEKKPIISTFGGKKESMQKLINQIKQEAKGCSAIVIATDVDPSGEGQLLAWEVINAIGWNGPVKRMYFTDEGAPSLQKGFKTMKDIPSQAKDGDFVKADARSRWDYISMQLTRIATHAARTSGYNAVVRQGRLKSVIVKMVADQLDAINNYKKTPYYEVKYKDENGHVYTRKVTDDDVDGIRFAAESDADKDKSKFGPSAVVDDGTKRKSKAPGKLLDLGALSSILATQGFKAKEVLATYQKMYDRQIVSYPRTEDKYITQGQFDEMLPLVDKIASVVNVDKSLLTHRKSRSTHVKDGGAHGANRPGLVVPKSLDSLSVFGPSAKAIYLTLAKNFLAMFGEDYIYDTITGHVQDHPTFKTSFSVPVDLGFKKIFDSENESKDKDDDEADDNIKPLGKKATSFVFEGFNKKPPYPTMKWVMSRLEKYNVGTGATRTSTLAEVSNGKTALLGESRGKLTMTQIGEISAVLIDGAYISDVKVTEKLFNNMDEVGKFKLDPNAVIDSATKLVAHDKKVFLANAGKLQAKVGKAKGAVKANAPKEKATGVYNKTGDQISFNIEWSGHRFTDDEVSKLLNGDTIEIDAVSAKTKQPFKVKGNLEQQTFKGKNGLVPFWGFSPKFEPKKKATELTAQSAPFKPEWSGHKFTKAEETKLRNGEKINIKAKSKAGKPYTVDVTFELTEFNGNPFWGIVPHFK